MDTSGSPRLVDVKEIAHILGVSPGWLYRRTQHGPEAFPHYKVGHHVRFDVQEVLTFIRNRKASGSTEEQGVSYRQ